MRTILSHAFRLGPLACLSLAVAPAAFAQTASTPVQETDHTPPAQSGAPVSPGSGPANGLEEITVTSERRTQSAQNVGSSISVISAKTLALRNVNDVYDLQYLTPSLQVTPQFGSGQPAFTIRGVGFNDYASDNAPTVGIYVDEVAYPVPFATNGLMFDVQRVEVLRGPQGTLYGRNTTGGAINYILNKPTHTLMGGVDVQYGRFGAAKADGYVSGPIGDKVQFRLSGETQQGNDWQHNREGTASLGDIDRSAARLLLDYEADDTLKFELNLHGSHERSNPAGLYLFAPSTALNTAHPGTYSIYPADSDRTATDWGTSSVFAKEVGIRPDAKPFARIDTGGANLRMDRDFSFATLTDLLSEDYAQRQEYDNFDSLPSAAADVFFNTRANVLANELRLTSPSGRKLTWVGGIYYANQYLEDLYATGVSDLFGFDRRVQYSQTVNTISGFGQLNYKLTDRLTLIGGLRVEHESRDLDNFTAFSLTNGIVTNPANTLAHRSTAFTEPTGKVEIDFNAMRNDMIYASISRGIKSGGFTAYNSNVVQVATEPFKPEKLWAYEIGNKFELPAARLRLNVSAFYYDYRDEQIQSAVVNPQTGLVGQIVNAPSSHLFGGEFDASWSPFRHLTLTQSVGWATGRFDSFSSVTSAVRVNGVYVGLLQNRNGETLPAPKLTMNGSASYSWELGRYRLLTGIDYSFRSTYHSLFGTLYDVAGYTLVDANVTFSPVTNRWSISAFGQNILDKHYDVTRNFFEAGIPIALAGEPATWGVRASVNF